MLRVQNFLQKLELRGKFRTSDPHNLTTVATPLRTYPY